MMTSPMVFVVKQEPKSDDESLLVEAAVPVPDCAESAYGGVEDAVANDDVDRSGGGESCNSCAGGTPRARGRRQNETACGATPAARCWPTARP
ncbi:hypothetical protein MRX96_028568 [Rhipicephalus microplus]